MFTLGLTTIVFNVARASIVCGGNTCSFFGAVLGWKVANTTFVIVSLGAGGFLLFRSMVFTLQIESGLDCTMRLGLETPFMMDMTRTC